MTTPTIDERPISEGFSRGPRAVVRRLETRVVDSGIAALSIFAYLFLYVPIIALIVFSFDRSPLSSSWTGFTWKWYTTLFHDSYVHHALTVSLIVAITAAICSTLISLLSAVVLSRLAFRGKRAFMAGLFLPLLVPEIVLAIALLTVVAKMNFPFGYATLISGHIVLTLPYGTLLLLGAASRLDPSLEEAASDLGCSGFTAFMRVTLPLLRPAVFASLLLSFTISFTDVVMSNFVGGPGTTTLPVYVYGLLKTGISPEINALGTLLVAGTLVVVAAIGMRQLTSIMAGQVGRHRAGAVELAELNAESV